MQACRRDTFFSALLAAAGVIDPGLTTNAKRRFALMCRLREQLLLRRGTIVVLLCDEAQRLSTDALEWLRDVHDQLQRQGSRLITFLVGQPKLLERKAEHDHRGVRCHLGLLHPLVQREENQALTRLPQPP